MNLIVPTSTVTDVAASTQGSFDSLAPLIVLLISVPLAFYVIRRIIALFPKPRSR